MWPNHLSHFLCINSTVPNFTPLANPSMPHFSCMPTLLSPSHVATSYAALRGLISTAHTLDYCALFPVQASNPYVNIERRMQFLKSLYLYEHSSLIHNNYTCSYNTSIFLLKTITFLFPTYTSKFPYQTDCIELIPCSELPLHSANTASFAHTWYHRPDISIQPQ